jgi:tRNA(Ile)-lysidine synthase
MRPPLDPLPLDASMLPDGAAVAVAFSGGLDSRALLQRLAETEWARSRGLRVLHVNHGLHPDAGALG